MAGFYMPFLSESWKKVYFLRQKSWKFIYLRSQRAGKLFSEKVATMHCLPLKWNMLKDSSGHPSSIYFIDKKQGKRDQGSISGIRIIPKR